jgi:hypothetical protein
MERSHLQYQVGVMALTAFDIYPFFSATLLHLSLYERSGE